MSDMDSIEQQLASFKQIVNNTLEIAKASGVSEAEVMTSRQQGISVATRQGEIETVEYTNDGALGITVYVGKRKGSASTADFSPKALKDTVEAACNIAKYTSEDQCSGLADKSLLEMNPQDLDLYHPHDINPEQAAALAIEAENASLAVDTRISNAEGASLNSHTGFKIYGNTHGQVVGYPSSRHSLSCVSIASDDEDMQRDYHYSVARRFGDLEPAAMIGKLSAEETLARLNSRKIATAKMPVLFRADIAASLFGHYVSAISGGSLYRKASFLLDAQGEQIFPEWLNISERPHLPMGLASSAFDSEGVKTQDLEVVQAGQLSTYLLTSYSARKLGMQTTGHAGGVHNWLVGHGDDDFKAMIKKMGRGLLVTELMGQGVNIVTGDYSRGASGFWVENGEIQYPVSEVTIAGNLKDIYRQIVAIGKDVDVRGSIQTGSILIEEMQVAGN